MTHSDSLQKTPLYSLHQQANARIVDFGGWALPVNFGSQVEEHHSVRNACGMFDVSHMTVSSITGTDTLPLLRLLLANDIDKTASLPGKALYSCLLNEEGGVIDDLIVYRLSDDHCRLITNATTNTKVMAWIGQHAAQFDVEFQEHPELALIAVQGPSALDRCIEHAAPLLAQDAADQLVELKRFQGTFLDIEKKRFAGRTGYTGEDGLELVLPAEAANEIWQALHQNGVQACGLGARDTLRLEAGMSLYGNDLDESHTPIESGIGWSVSLSDEREFIGKNALMEPARYRMIGLVLIDKGVLRRHQPVLIEGQPAGEITSGSFSPTLEKSIALARISNESISKIGDQVEIEVRKKRLRAEIVRTPFIKKG